MIYYGSKIQKVGCLVKREIFPTNFLPTIQNNCILDNYFNVFHRALPMWAANQRISSHMGNVK